MRTKTAIEKSIMRHRKKQKVKCSKYFVINCSKCGECMTRKHTERLIKYRKVRIK